MKQIVQNFKNGTTSLVETPCPAVKEGCLLIATSTSLISAGTERMLVDFGRSGMLFKAHHQPEKVKQVIEKIKTDGLIPTINTVQSKLDQDIPMGYCNAGVVMEVGEGINGIKPGARVASNGSHAEMVSVPQNLCAKIPETVSNEEAAFTVLGSIALQGVRLANPTLGESFAVIGLGLVGLLTMQILQANGCKVLGIDKDQARLQLARQFGASTVDISKGENPVSAGFSFTGGKGIDGVLIAAATKSNQPVEQAAKMSRKKGRIVLIGVTGLELSRADFYEKELSFQVSCSYGPGRYDRGYEEKGRDYPLEYVRWTEQRNLEAVLELIASGKLDVKPLITHRFNFEEADKAYNMLGKEKEPYLGIVLNYPGVNLKDLKKHQVIRNKITEKVRTKGAVINTAQPVIGLIGAGNFTGQVLLPVLKKTEGRLKTIAANSGLSAAGLSKKFGFEASSSNAEEIFSSSDVNTVFITTRHDTHAQFVRKALRAGKHVFVEKPLCLNVSELEDIKNLYQDMISRNDQEGIPLLMVGFNRRFSPFARKMKELLDNRKEPKSFIMTVNAGSVPSGHWVQDPEIGGGRIVGEACHFIDLLRFLAGAPVIDVKTVAMNNSSDGINEDKVSFILSFKDGSLGTVHYLANGNKSFPKERLEVFCGGQILVLDNFKKLSGYRWPGFKTMKSLKQIKGHEEEVFAFIQAVQSGGPAPISFHELVEVTTISFQVAEQAKKKVKP